MEGYICAYCNETVDDALRISERDIVRLHGECFIDMLHAMALMTEAMNEMRQIVAMMQIENQDARQRAKITFH